MNWHINFQKDVTFFDIYRLTAADCVLGYNLWWALEMRDGVLLRDYPVIMAYFDRLSRRSAFQRVFNTSE